MGDFMKYEKEQLNAKHFIYISKDCRFGEDALALSRFVSISSKKVIFDLGTGSGIIPIMLCEKTLPKAIVAIEKNPDFCEMARQSVLDNHLEDTITIMQSDWNDLKLSPESVDIITCNPPYFKKGSGKVSENEAVANARHAAKNSPEDICLIAEKLLKNGGDFCVSYKPENLENLLYFMRQHHLEPKEICLLMHKENSEPWLCLCKAKKNAKPGLKIEIV